MATIPVNHGVSFDTSNVGTPNTINKSSIGEFDTGIDDIESGSFQYPSRSRVDDSRDEDDEEDEEPAPVSSDHVNISSKRFNKNKAMHFMMMSFSSLGVIYGDIGTSPLYVFSTAVNDASVVNEKTILGVMSCIFWLFTIVVVVKYCVFVLELGPNDGEGGQIAIYAKIARTLKIGPRGVIIPGDKKHTDDLLTLTRAETSDSFIKNGGKIRDDPFVTRFLSKFILIACFLGCSLVISDGLLTPTTSVLSAIEGIAVAVPSMSDKTVPISVCVLLALFLIQRWGSGKISLLFAPIIFIWLVCLFIIGVVNISKYPSVMKSLNPKYAIDLLKQEDVYILGSVMLSITGVEAAFADIGHIGKAPIQYTLTFFVYPCLMVTYLGQAAFIILNPTQVDSVFYQSIPGGTNSGFYWVMFVLAALATVIASQALILGVFSILKQLIYLDCFPQFKIIQVSKSYSGQVYIPLVNWILMVGVICTTVGFQTSAAVTSAYGLGISIDLVVTTTLITICMIYVYNYQLGFALLFLVIFGSLEFCLVIGNGSKIIHGAWFPLMITAIMCIFITVWRWCRGMEVNQEFNTRVKIGEVFTNLELKPVSKNVDLRARGVRNIEIQVPTPAEYDLDSLQEAEPKGMQELITQLPFGKQVVERYDGVAIMYTNVMHTLNSPNTIPYMLKSMVQSFPSLPKTLIFLCVRVSPNPFVADEDRFIIQPMKVPGFYRCVVKFGFMDRMEVSNKVITEILNNITEITDMRDIQSLGNEALNIPILHVFERNMIYSKKIFEEFEENHPKLKFLTLPINLLKEAIIENFYFPIKSLSHGTENMLKVNYKNNGYNKDSNQEILYVGNRVEI